MIFVKGSAGSWAIGAKPTSSSSPNILTLSLSVALIEKVQRRDVNPVRVDTDDSVTLLVHIACLEKVLATLGTVIVEFVHAETRQIEADLICRCAHQSVANGC